MLVQVIQYFIYCEKLNWVSAQILLEHFMLNPLDPPSFVTYELSNGNHVGKALCARQLSDSA